MSFIFCFIFFLARGRWPKTCLTSTRVDCGGKIGKKSRKFGISFTHVTKSHHGICGHLFARNVHVFLSFSHTTPWHSGKKKTIFIFIFRLSDSKFSPCKMKEGHSTQKPSMFIHISQEILHLPPFPPPFEGTHIKKFSIFWEEGKLIINAKNSGTRPKFPSVFVYLTFQKPRPFIPSFSQSVTYIRVSPIRDKHPFPPFPSKTMEYYSSW